jgi:2-dehydropantoate 2-reductase
MGISIAVVGAGRIGSTFAYRLARAGNDVTMIARPGSIRLQQLQRDQGIALTSGERISTSVSSNLDESIEYDLIIVTVLAHQVDAVLPALARSRAKSIHFMFINFEPEYVVAAVGAERASLGMPFEQADFDDDGQLKTASGIGKTLHGDKRWVELFNDAGISSVFEPDMPLWLRCHVPFTIALESISVIAERRGKGASWSEAMTVARGMHGGWDVIKGLGHTIYPAPKAVMHASPTSLLALMLWSLSRVTSFRELLATGLNECLALLETMEKAAAKAKPAVSAKALMAMKP